MRDFKLNICFQGFCSALTVIASVSPGKNHPFIYSKISIQNTHKKQITLEKTGECRIYISHKMGKDKMRCCR